MVIFTRTYEFVSWIIPLSLKFPRSQRFVVTQRLQQAVLNLQELLIQANVRRGRERRDALLAADAALVTVKLYLRLCHRWQWLSNGQFQRASEQAVEIGKLLGGWIKTVTGTTRSDEAPSKAA